MATTSSGKDTGSMFSTSSAFQFVKTQPVPSISTQNAAMSNMQDMTDFDDDEAAMPAQTPVIPPKAEMDNEDEWDLPLQQTPEPEATPKKTPKPVSVTPAKPVKKKPVPKPKTKPKKVKPPKKKKKVKPVRKPAKKEKKSKAVKKKVKAMKKGGKTAKRGRPAKAKRTVKKAVRKGRPAKKAKKSARGRKPVRKAGKKKKR